MKKINEVQTDPHPLFGRSVIGYRYLDNDRVIVLYRMFTNVRLVIGTDYDIRNGWCYDPQKFDIAWKALETWDGQGDPPDGWHRNPFDGRRRPDGDKSREYVHH